MLKITELAGELNIAKYCDCALGLFTGEDTNFALKGKGKIFLLKKVQQAPRFQQALCSLGDECDVDDGHADELENLTCTIRC